MGERIHFVVPDGTTAQITAKAKREGHTVSALMRKITLAAIKDCEHTFAPCNAKGEFLESKPNPGDVYYAKCTTCGYQPRKA